ncbi:MAG: hypothetical protein HKO65_04730 [Gemmatimonadetes bacterium]|nr:hypothetical protein [Gemmatimonadota bacterium]NNM04386.1 hypothetical protein [Gemmatimonadota bacterium]
MELSAWLAEREERVAASWLAHLRSRSGKPSEEEEVLLEYFLVRLVSLLPTCFGERKEAGEEAWHQATYLFGSVALQRALSAGEVVEEFGILREILLKMLLEDPAAGWENRVFRRDLLGLNRLLDQGVVRASVAYVDDLFFAHLQGSGIPEGLTPELEEETRRQLDGLMTELKG